jgi:glycosyltransferase involved in cell wall biosynthesis
MKILLHYPAWGNRWIPYINEELSRYDLTVTTSHDPHEVARLSQEADILMSMWASEVVEFWTKTFGHKKIITYLRRYESHTPLVRESTILFNRVDAVIFVSEFYRDYFNELLDKGDFPGPKCQYVIPNGVDLSGFPLRKRRATTNKIALVCSFREVKNIALAFQILLNLPKRYTLHQIGIAHKDISTWQLFTYMENLGLGDRFTTEGEIPPDQVSSWLEDKEFIISTSLNEGNPNNIIEAMSMGIKPIIHNWPGAKDQFPESLIFNTVDEAVELIKKDYYNPSFYRMWVKDKYSLENFKQLHKVIERIMGGE